VLLLLLLLLLAGVCCVAAACCTALCDVAPAELHPHHKQEVKYVRRSMYNAYATAVPRMQQCAGVERRRSASSAWNLPQHPRHVPDGFALRIVDCTILNGTTAAPAVVLLGTLLLLLLLPKWQCNKKLVTSQYTECLTATATSFYEAQWC
jgi:hypothetical protein